MVAGMINCTNSTIVVGGVTFEYSRGAHTTVTLYTLEGYSIVSANKMNTLLSPYKTDDMNKYSVENKTNDGNKWSAQK